ncbi:MAG: hypothetical protein ACRYG5_08950 [Janthinobacterium lividum]
MIRKWRTPVLVLVALLVLASWAYSSLYDRVFKMPELREHLSAGLDTEGAPVYRNEAIAEHGALCGQVRNVTGGERIAGLREEAPQRGIVPIATSSWRRFIVAPDVPAFYVEGLAPWGLSMDGKRIKVDVADMAQQADIFRAQYTAAQPIDVNFSAAQAAHEIDVKVLAQNFEIAWGDYCGDVAF